MPGRAALYLCAAISALAGVAVAAPVGSDEGDVRAGRSFAGRHCVQCHEIGNAPTPSAMFKKGPAFRDIANKSTTTPLALRVFLTTPHPTMPNLILSRTEIDNIVAYIMSLRPPAKEHV